MYRILLLTLFCFVGTLAHADDDANVKLFEVHSRLAAKGSAEAQFKLGEMCEEGRGTPRDLAKAREWYELAASQGHEEAQRRLFTLGERRSHDDAARMAREAQLKQQRAEEERKAALAQQREEEERRAALERRRAEEQQRQHEQRQHEQRLKETAELQAQRRLEEERAKQAALRRKQDEAKAQAERQAQASTPPAATNQSTQGEGKNSSATSGADHNQESFESDPCKGAAARFMSTCR